MAKKITKAKITRSSQKEDVDDDVVDDTPPTDDLEHLASDDDIYTIVPENIKTEYVRIPALIARASEALAVAQAAAALAKHKRDRVHATKYLDLVQQYEDLGEKKPADAKIKAEVTRSDDYHRAVTDYILKEQAKGKVLGVLEGLRAKREMLVSLGAHVRLEMQSAHSSAEDDDEEVDTSDEDQ